ncbi:MAG: DNA adenine methylase [Candidatus Obscuribacterales bacterium]|nr:DNA adenine methylase [Candidatus Obscuribacterales bacterium]
MRSKASRVEQKSILQGLPSKEAAVKAGPVLKWAGGKSRLLNSYEEFFPQNFKSYFEPFTGGAAVFFHLKNKHKNFKATLSDLNQELINCYTIIRDQAYELIADLKKHKNEEEYFYALRAVATESLSPIERASRLIYLNKTCFNGLYRVNSKGKFNVPFGFYKNPATCNETSILASSQALKDCDLNCSPFDAVLKHAKKGDFVYFDPPYHPLSSTANFTSYTKDSFSGSDQERLAETFAELDRRGCLLMLSNSDCEFIRNLYKNYRTETVYALRAINCKAEGRGKISEVLVLNY